MDEFEQWYRQQGGFADRNFAKDYWEKNIRPSQQGFNNGGFGGGQQNNYGMLSADYQQPQNTQAPVNYNQGQQGYVEPTPSTFYPPTDYETDFTHQLPNGTYENQNNNFSLTSPENAIPQYPEYNGPNMGGYQTATAQNSMKQPFSAPIGTGVVGLAELGIGLANSYKHRNDTLPMFNLTPRMEQSIAEAERMRGYGFTPSERQSYENKLASDNYARFQRALSVAGGQSSQAITSALATQGFDARNQMAIADARQRRENISMSNQLNQIEQNLKNANVEARQQQYLRNQQATANAIHAGLQNVGMFANLLLL